MEKIAVAGCEFERGFPKFFYTAVLYYVRFLQPMICKRNKDKNE